MAELSAVDAPSTGVTTAPVTLVMFSDFECPFCRKFASTLKDVEGKEQGHLKVVLRSLPLSIHPGAERDAELAECVAHQNRTEFWNLYDFFYSQSTSSPPSAGDAIEFLRERQQVNMELLNSCVTTHAAREQIERDAQLANKYGVRATPTFFVNGIRIVGGMISSKNLEDLIESQIKPSTEAGGPPVKRD